MGAIEVIIIHREQKYRSGLPGPTSSSWRS